MSMKNEKAIVERLSLLRGQIVSIDETDPKSQRIIGIDLYEYIQSVPLLQKMWREHISYMNDLRHDEYYISLENLLWEAAERLAKVGVSMCDAGISDPVSYKNPFTKSADQPQDLVLRDALSLYLDKENRISILDFEKRKKALGFLHTETNDHFRRRIVQQFADLFPIIWFNKSIRDNHPEEYSKDFPALLLILKDKLKTLENYLILQPNRLGLESFESVQSIADRYAHNLHEEITFPLTVARIILNSSEKPERSGAEDSSIKKAAIEVCDKLIWAITKEDSAAQSAKNEEPVWVRCMDFEICTDPLALRRGKDMLFEERMEGKVLTEKDKERRKALRVIAAFAPEAGSPEPRHYENMAELGKVLRIKDPSPQVSIARKFLKEEVASAFTISDGRGGRRIMFESMR
ncbi:MAG: hypothetical protein PHX87_02590 [Candidatus Peribacteraceae bacterium]|nr:hypothetical protein [Candidatus Peribacteraceae bacterium]